MKGRLIFFTTKGKGTTNQRGRE